MKRYCFFVIIFTLLSVAYTTAHHRDGGMEYTVYPPLCVCADTTSMSQADSLALAMAESMAMMMDDSMFGELKDSVPAVQLDSTALVVQADSTTLIAQADSMAVDSAKLKNLIPDSLIVGYLPERTSWKYFEVKERSADDVQKLKTLYKKTMAEHNGALHAYDGWKVAFNSTKERTLDMYLDGAKMILSRFCADTLNKRYDRLSEHRDELMELYDLAVFNLDALNAQLDKAKNKDTLSVAKFRGRQLRYYRDITMVDVHVGRCNNLLVSRIHESQMSYVVVDIVHQGIS